MSPEAIYTWGCPCFDCRERMRADLARPHVGRHHSVRVILPGDDE